MNGIQRIGQIVIVIELNKVAFRSSEVKCQFHFFSSNLSRVCRELRAQFDQNQIKLHYELGLFCRVFHCLAVGRRFFSTVHTNHKK